MSHTVAYQKVEEVSVASVDDDCVVIGPLDDDLVDLVRGDKGGWRNGDRH